MRNKGERKRGREEQSDGVPKSNVLTCGIPVVNPKFGPDYSVVFHGIVCIYIYIKTIFRFYLPRKMASRTPG
jgi:hypothetical protein